MKVNTFHTENESVIYLAYFDENTLPKEPEISDSDKDKLKNITALPRRREFLFTRVLLHYILPKEEITYTASGAPILKSKIKHISISHSSDAVIIMVSNYECGIDLELLKRDYKKVAPKFITKKDIPPKSTEEMAAIWATKEAIYKLYKGNINIFNDIITTKIKPDSVSCTVLDKEIKTQIIIHKGHIIAYCEDF